MSVATIVSLCLCAAVMQVSCGIVKQPKPLDQSQPGFAALPTEDGVVDYQFVDINLLAGKLSDYRGKIVILDVWATWCPDCHEEIPRYRELHARYKDRDVAVIGLSVDETWDPVPKFAEEYFIGYDLHWGSRDEAVEVFGPITEIPTTFILDKTGHVVEKLVGNHSAEEYVAVIEKLL
jgi:peroxiredoxin